MAHWAIIVQLCSGVTAIPLSRAASISFHLLVTRDCQLCGEMLRCWGQRGPAGIAGSPPAAGSAPKEMQRGSRTKPPAVLGTCPPPRSGGHLVPVQQHGPCYQAYRSQTRLQQASVAQFILSGSAEPGESACCSPMQEIGCVPRLPGPACSCSSDTGEPKPTFLGMAGQQM